MIYKYIIFILCLTSFGCGLNKSEHLQDQKIHELEERIKAIENTNMQSINLSKDEGIDGTKYVFFVGQDHYSKIFTIENYTENKFLALKNCIREKIQFETSRDRSFSCEEHVFYSYKAASEEYQKLSGTKMMADEMCDNELNEYE
jgi:hypothetical protein